MINTGASMIDKIAFKKMFLIIFFVVFMSCISGCAIHSVDFISYTISPVVQKQFKLTFKPDQAYLTDKEIAQFFDNAKSAGLELGYEIVLMDQGSGKISFVRNHMQNKYSIKAVVFVDLLQNRQLAYVYITLFGDSQDVVDSAMSEFKKQYASKFR